jgi:hypothetical protein
VITGGARVIMAAHRPTCQGSSLPHGHGQGRARGVASRDPGRPRPAGVPLRRRSRRISRAWPTRRAGDPPSRGRDLQGGRRGRPFLRAAPRSSRAGRRGGRAHGRAGPRPSSARSP